MQTAKEKQKLDEKWMMQAIHLAKKGISGASPNPLVGCLIVKNNKVVGKGYHAFFGAPHAEINALKDSKWKSDGATMYVNLEPCSHWGKTPPCTETLIRSKIGKIVIGMPDPNPLVRGRGIRALKKSGIRVRTGVCLRESEELNRPFIKFMRERKPYVILKSALSLDGKIAAASGESQWITSKESRNFSHQLRCEADAIMVGAGTVRTDNPSLTSHGKGRNPVRVIVSCSGNIPADAGIFDGKSKTLVFHGNPSLKHQKHSPKNSEWFFLPARKGRIDFARILKNLAGKGISKLLIEGGGETSASALESGEVDEIYFFIAPLLIGGRSAKTAFEGGGFPKIKNAIRLENLSVKKVGRDLLVHAYILK